MKDEVYSIDIILCAIIMFFYTNDKRANIYGDLITYSNYVKSLPEKEQELIAQYIPRINAWCIISGWDTKEDSYNFSVIIIPLLRQYAPEYNWWANTPTDMQNIMDIRQKRIARENAVQR